MPHCPALRGSLSPSASRRRRPLLASCPPGASKYHPLQRDDGCSRAKAQETARLSVHCGVILWISVRSTVYVLVLKCQSSIHRPVIDRCTRRPVPQAKAPLHRDSNGLICGATTRPRRSTAWRSDRPPAQLDDGCRRVRRQRKAPPQFTSDRNAVGGNRTLVPPEQG